MANQTTTYASVSVVPCTDYDDGRVVEALNAVLAPIGGLDWVTEGMTVGIKANLVSAMKPEECATTHPALLCALTRMLRERGARVIIGDSPGGLYTPAFVEHVYAASGMNETVVAGAELNHDYGQTDTAFADARVLKSFTYTSWLDGCDAIINFCKLKSHGMMGMSAAAKNLFGVIPGTMKPEYHFRFPSMADFAHMLVDINDYFAPKVKLSLVDAVEGMEGNGPTKGTPRHIGLLMASASAHAVDVLGAHVMGLTVSDVPTLLAARERNLIPDSIEGMTLLLPEGMNTSDALVIRDFENVAVRRSHLFSSKGVWVSRLLGTLLSSRPALKASDCVGCAKCARICPAHAIVMKNGKAVIDRSACIRCFCCQEFCPTGAMKVHRTLVARLLVRNRKG